MSNLTIALVDSSAVKSLRAEKPSSRSEKTSEIAAHLAKRASEPCPAGDYVKAAITRTSERTGIAYGRARDIWYGEARRIDAWEMDVLREAADAAEWRIALDGVAMARRKLEGSTAPHCREALASLDEVLRILGGDAGGAQPTSEV
ncbi:hypothetical protein [Bradyrhizobium sp. 2S1]|uniref:hypothetical protein n=1 Tax=Bradyrhizobium sp. 2S1 TaxID=1404429 RepID=UPI00140A1529|nr:hypothetical protein [Bradyrhizobium sp. 2S1]MCK7669109.1 hypothetical protein [Bradyrhizobium sp. 2S1]